MLRCSPWRRLDDSCRSCLLHGGTPLATSTGPLSRRAFGMSGEYCGVHMHTHECICRYTTKFLLSSFEIGLDLSIVPSKVRVYLGLGARKCLSRMPAHMCRASPDLLPLMLLIKLLFALEGDVSR